MLLLYFNNRIILKQIGMDREELFEKKPMIKIHGKLFPCPTSAAMELIGGKWKSVILTHLVDGKKRYNELRKEMPTITERTLSLQLKQLEADGLVARKVYTKKPPLKVVYSLTTFGNTVTPVLQQINEWGIIAAYEKSVFINLNVKGDNQTDIAGKHNKIGKNINIFYYNLEI